ncbi:MAG: leucine-rich repeat protein [Ruminococcus sp.]|nr:leucine-rich repeat protein [Ruminococcus sp.]
MKKILRKGISCILSMLVLLQGWLFVPNDAAALEEDWSPETTTAATTENVGQVQEWEQFQYQISENEVTIVGYVGTIEGTLEIPAEIDGLPVTRVEDDAFIKQNQLVEVVIPASVIEIGSTAFHDCENLQVFTVAEENPVYCVKNGLLLDKGEKVLIRCPSGRYGEVTDIPDTVFLISDAAFADCSSLSKIELPVSVLSIGAMAFSNCQSLSEVIVPSGVQILPDSAFADCIALQRVTLSEGLTNISVAAFKNCTALQEVQLPDTLESIKSNAFENCSSLQRMHFPAAVSELSANAFSGCISLSEVTVAAENPYYTAVDGVLMTADQETLVYYPSCSSQSDYTIPETVKTIDSYAFQDAMQLQFLTVPETVETIEPYACYDANSLKEVMLNGASVISAYAFQSCDQLEAVVFGDGVQEVQTGAFLDCPSLKSIILPKTITTIEDYAFGYQTDSAEAGTYSMVKGFFICFYKYTAGAYYAALNGFDSLSLDDVITTTTTAVSANVTTTTETKTETTASNQTTAAVTTAALETTSKLETSQATATKAETTAVVTTTTIAATTNRPETSIVSTTTPQFGTTTTTTTHQHGGTATTITTGVTTQTTAVTGQTTQVTTELKGDLNLDGRLSIVDAIRVLTYYAKMASGQAAYLYSEDPDVEEAAKRRVDMDGNGRIDTTDAVEILIIYAKTAAGQL